MYSLKPIIPKKNPDTVSPTIPQILKFASSRNTENAKRTMSMISLLICFCLASSSSRALRSMAAFDLADVFDAVFFFADVLLFDPPFEEFFATVFLRRSVFWTCHSLMYCSCMTFYYQQPFSTSILNLKQQNTILQTRFPIIIQYMEKPLKFFFLDRIKHKFYT